MKCSLMDRPSPGTIVLLWTQQTWIDSLIRSTTILMWWWPTNVHGVAFWIIGAMHPNGDASSTCKKTMRTHASSMWRLSCGEKAWGHMLLTCSLPYGFSMWIDDAPHMVCPHDCFSAHGWKHIMSTRFAAWRHIVRSHEDTWFWSSDTRFVNILLMISNVRTHVKKREDTFFKTMRTHAQTNCPHCLNLEDTL